MFSNEYRQSWLRVRFALSVAAVVFVKMLLELREKTEHNLPDHAMRVFEVAKDY